MASAARAARIPFAMAGLALCLAAAAPALSRTPEERDRQGRVVRRTDGERVLYARVDEGPRAARPPVVRARAAAMPQGVLDVREEWRWQVMGTGIGETGLHVVDVDGDGSLEVVAANDQRYWYVLEHVANDYRQTWVSDPFPEYIESLRVLQLDADPALEVVVGAGSEVRVYDGATHALQTSFTSTARAVLGLAIADVDGDGGQEAVFCGDVYDGPLYVHDLATGAEEYRSEAFSCRDVAIGNVDLDPDPEIVVGRGAGTGYVLNGATRAVEWANFFGFGYQVRIANLDGVGANEIVVAYGWQSIALFDATQQSLFASLPTSHDVGAVRVVDVEGDGPLEIVYGDGQWGEIHVHDGRTLALKWQVDNPEHGVSDVAIGDADNDGQRELLWGAGGSSTGPDHLYVVSVATQATEWTSLDVAGPFTALAHGDVDADGRPELLHGANLTDVFGSGLWFVHDAIDHSLESIREADRAILRLGVANVDADVQPEVFLLSEYRLECRDGLTQAVQWSRDFTYYDEPASLGLGNVDADAALELVIGTSTDNALQIQVLSAGSGAVEWVSPTFGGAPLSFLRLGNVDADPNVEIVVASILGGVYMVDGTTHVFNALGDHDVRGLDLADMDGNGVAEIVVAGGNTVRVIATNGTVVSTLATVTGEVGALAMRDVSGDGRPDPIVVVENVLEIRDGQSGGLLWSSGTLVPYSYSQVGLDDAMVAADVDADGRLEVLLSLGYIGVRLFEVPNVSDLELSVTDAPDPALVGGTVQYSWVARNRSLVAATSVALQVALPAGAALVSTTPPAPTCTSAGAQVTCALGTLAGSASVGVSVVVSPQAAGTMQSVGAVSSGTDPDPGNDQATATTVVTNTVEADVSLSIGDGRALVRPGQALAYAIAVRNFGPWPVSSVTLIAALPAALESPVYVPMVGSYDPGTGSWTGLDLPPGQMATLRLEATVASGAAGSVSTAATVAPPAGVTDLVPGNNAGTDVDVVAAGATELAHGTSRRARLDASGERYFAMRQQPWSSYEVLVDEVSGDLGSVAAPVRLQRLGDGAVVLAEAQAATGVGFARSLRWRTPASVVDDGQAIRVRSSGCGSDCGADDHFRIRAYDTTCDVPRFNNALGQTTVLILQNVGRDPVTGTVDFWSATGAPLAQSTFSSLPAGATHILATSTLAALAGQSGSITVASDAPYGTLAGKAVSIDPATGFAFDTPMRARPR